MYILTKQGNEIKNNEQFMEEVYKTIITNEEVRTL